jgi:hypothetical protein
MRNPYTPRISPQLATIIPMIVLSIILILLVPIQAQAKLHPERVITTTTQEDIDGLHPYKCWMEESWCWWTRPAYQAPRPYVVTNSKENARTWYKRQRI